jgi:SAM-dependent methyltransferase
MSAEFDRYARDYDALLKDPIRDRFAQNPDFFHLRKWLLLQEFLRRWSIPSQNSSWLDIGCGKGELLHFGQASFRQAVGCDPSQQMLSECSGLDVRQQPENGVLPFADSSFDVVTAACVYHHLDPAERLALSAEAYRVMRPGGLFVIFEHNPWNPATRLIVHRTPVDANANLLTAAEARALVREAGFAVRKTCYYLYFPQSLYRRLASLERLLGVVPAGGQYAVFARRLNAAK